MDASHVCHFKFFNSHIFKREWGTNETNLNDLFNLAVSKILSFQHIIDVMFYNYSLEIFHSFLGTKFSNLAYILPFFSILIRILNFYLKYLICI